MKVSELKADLDALAGDAKARFDAMDGRFEAMDKRFEGMDKRFDAMDRRFDAMDRRFEGIDKRFDAMDRRFDAMDARFEAMDAKFETLRQDVRNEITREGAATRLHFDVVAESIRADVAPFMAQLATTDERVAMLRSERKTFKEALDDHEIRLQALERHRG